VVINQVSRHKELKRKGRKRDSPRDNPTSSSLNTPRYSNKSDLLSHHRDDNALFPYQSRTALTSAAILDELDKAQNYEHDSGETENTILEDMGFRLEPKEVLGKGPGWDATDLHPFLVGCDSSTLCSVDEFSQRDVRAVAKDMNILETPGTVLELDAQEVADIRRRATAQFNCESRRIIRYASDIGMFLGDASLTEKRDEGLVGGLNQHKLKWISIEGNALQRTDDCVKDCSTGDIADAVDVFV